MVTSYQSIADLTSFANDVLTSRWWKSKYPTHTIRKAVVTASTSAGTCNMRRLSNWTAGSFVLRLGKTRSHQIAVLHALAHAVAAKDEPWHGRDFAKKWLELTERFLGKPEAARLREQYRIHKIKRKTMSEEFSTERKIAHAANVWTQFLTTNQKDSNDDDATGRSAS